MRLCYDSMLLPDRMLFDSPFAYIELPEKISPVTLNVFFKALPEV